MGDGTDQPWNPKPLTRVGSEEAKRALRPMFEEHVKFAVPPGMLRYRQDQMEQFGPTGVPARSPASISTTSWPRKPGSAERPAS
jgi:hypothetical protein